MDRSSALLWMDNISKSFPGVRALENVSLHVGAGEVLGLIGQNGAGKSTLMKILSGVYSVDEGEIYLEGQPVHITDPHQAQELGIAIIYQELNLMPNLTVMENILIGREPGPPVFFSRGKMIAQTRAILEHLKLDLSPKAIVRSLSVAEQQMVEIAKTISRQVKVLIMDEPTSALSETEAATLFGIIRELKQSGIGIIFISHRLEEVLEVCDRITVLRDGQHVADTSVEGTSKDELITMMVGRSLDTFFHEDEVDEAERQEDVVLEVQHLARSGTARDPDATVLEDVSFNLRRGEILGLAGLVGAGRTELARALFGADKSDSGAILIDGEPATITSPRDAIKHGMGLLPEDRKEQGLILEMAVSHNMSLVDLDEFTRFGFVQWRRETQTVMDFVDRFEIRTPDIDRKVVNLSGGNQQKVVISKWLMVKPKILIMDEPTRGIDVGAKSDIYDLMRQLSTDGISIIMISSEFPELLAMCDRIVCLTEGRVTAILRREEASLETLMYYCTMRERAIVAPDGETKQPITGTAPVLDSASANDSESKKDTLL